MTEKEKLIKEYKDEKKENDILDDGRKVKKVKFKKNWLDKVIKKYGKDLRV